MNKKFDRKKFLKITGLSALGIIVGGSLKIFQDDVFNVKKSPSNDLKKNVKDGLIKENKKKTDVSIAAVDNGIEKAIHQAAESATDFSWLKKGQTVFIKPVVNSGYEYPSTTNPLAVAAMIKLLKEKGAGRVIVGDMSGIEHLKFFKDETQGSTKNLMARTGILKAVEDAGGEPHFFEESGWNAFYQDKTDTAELFSQGIMMPDILKEADHIVLMPRCSRHVLAGASLGLKAAVGYWRTDTRLHYHEDGHMLQEMTAEGNRAQTLLDKQRLVISTGDKILATFGPDKGFVYKPDQGIVIASESIVAHDMIALSWLLYNRHLLPAEKINTFADTSKGVAKTANRFVVAMLSRSKGRALLSQPLFKNHLKSIWDDRVLNHAYRLFGGIPAVRLKNVKSSVKQNIVHELQKLTRFPFS